jgi:hypothetical protein
MWSKLLYVIVAGCAFVAGVLSGSVHRYMQAPSPKSTLEQPVKEQPYPEDSGIEPFEIASFIDSHPHADLTPLWERLHITGNFIGVCGWCKASRFEYDLDNDSENEVVLQIKHQVGEFYRYLVFDDSRRGYSKFLGHIDVTSKYTPSDPLVLVSNGQPFLILQSTAATGSGLAAWLDTIYRVSNSGVRPVATYLSKVHQSGGVNFPHKVFVGRPLSCEIKNGHAILNLSYTVEYSGGDIPLFSKTQKAILVGSVGNEESFLDTAHSEMSQHEFDSIYQVDSMGAEEFLQYNHSELRAIAAGHNVGQKKWLNHFLNTCEPSGVKRELLGLLRRSPTVSRTRGDWLKSSAFKTDSRLIIDPPVSAGGTGRSTL